MNLRIGIVGLPNAGKSTLFNALLKKQVADVAPYPFCTIEPNVGVVPVPDERLEQLAQMVERDEHERPPIVPAIVEFVDIAGLVKGASEGQGLGNKFLSHIREVDLICHVVRFFSDPGVVHVAGDIDAGRDKAIIETELILADLQTIAKQAEPRGVADKAAFERWKIVLKLKEGLNEGHLAKDVVVDLEERAYVKELQLLTMKPFLSVANVSEGQLISGTVIPAQAGIINEMIKICAQTESELSALSSEDQKAYLKEMGLDASGLDRLIQKAYESLGLLSFLTQGIKEVRAWTIVKGMNAPQAAGVIHTDFEKKFIKAEVISFDDLMTAGGWKKAKETGKLRMEGKEYAINDGDVVEFKIGS